jgi:hypothetical protein
MSGLTVSNGNRGGIGLESGSLTLNNCVIADNQSPFSGAGLSANFNSTVTLENCTFSRNAMLGSSFPGLSIIQGGGALGGYQSNLQVRNCTFDSNSSVTEGAAIFNDTGTLTVTSSTFFRNRGGGVSNLGDRGSASATILSCTFSEDRGPCIRSVALTSSDGEGSSSLTLGNTVLYVRITNSSGTATLFVPTGPGEHFTSRGYNIANDAAHGVLTGPGDIINMDPKLDPHGLVYSAGYTRTIALAPNSPAIDQGRSLGLTSDQRGQPRTVDNPFVPSAPGGDGTDIGAAVVPAQPCTRPAMLPGACFN